MKKLVTNFLLLLFVGILVYGVLTRAPGAVDPRLLEMIDRARAYFAEHTFITISAFCLAHLLASMLCIPGSCTFLNTLAGGVFGFWLGCGIVYPITVISALLMYFLGGKVRDTRLAARYEARINPWRDWLSRSEFLFLVSLRLNPLLPFGILNAVMGIARVPFPLYVMTTVVGIFFDVTILNNLGAGLLSRSPQSEKGLAIGFFVLLILFFLLRIVLTKAYDQASRGNVER